jgi:hypothetical protein
MTAPDGLIRIPLNEEAGKGTGQIEEFLMQFNGEGIQHIALSTDDLAPTRASARATPVHRRCRLRGRAPGAHAAEPAARWRPRPSSYH